MADMDARVASPVHVRTKPPPKRGNQWYRDRSIPAAHTLCGAPLTDRDLSLREARFKCVQAWCRQHACPICMEIALRGRGGK